jgi:hypothetical protein
MRWASATASDFGALMTINATHDPSLSSWVTSANTPDTNFPIQNLPHGVFRRKGTREAWRGGVAIGDQVLDMAAAFMTGVFEPSTRVAALAAGAGTLNGLMAMSPSAWSALRAELSRLLRADAPEAQRLSGCLIAQADAEYTLPGEHRRLHRLLHVDAPHAQRGPHLPARRPTAAEFQMAADRIPRPRLVDRGQRYELHAPARPDPPTRRGGTELRTDSAARLRDGAGLLGRCRQ